MTPVCDLVLLSWNHLEETKPCLESLFETTKVPCRLFIVDNGSEPEVRAFLASLTPRNNILEVTLLQNESNEGFPRGMNRGIRASSAPYVCLLNNDLRLTVGWLAEMIEVAKAHPDIGVLNPASSTLGNYPPPGLSLQEHADYLKRFRGQFKEVGMCIGYCMLIKREVLDRVGELSEEVERIFFEDEDFCMRAQQAGYRCVVAAAAYAYHAEHKSVNKMPEREALFGRNRDWCNAKWGKRIRIAWPRFDLPAPGTDELRAWLTRLLSWARRRSHVYVYAPAPRGLTVDGLFESVGLVAHADIQWRPIAPVLPGMAAAGLILQRRKKPFDIILTPTPSWGRRISRLGWLHGAAVVPVDNEEQLIRQWRQRSRSPSSS